MKWLSRIFKTNDLIRQTWRRQDATNIRLVQQDTLIRELLAGQQRITERLDTVDAEMRQQFHGLASRNLQALSDRVEGAIHLAQTSIRLLEEQNEKGLQASSVQTDIAQAVARNEARLGRLIEESERAEIRALADAVAQFRADMARALTELQAATRDIEKTDQGLALQVRQSIYGASALLMDGQQRAIRLLEERLEALSPRR